MSGRVHIGIAGWSYPDWEGIVYPRKRIDQLAYVCGFVDVIEINSTFYRPPTVRNSRSWQERTEKYPDFFFSAKLHRDFTHEGRIDAELVKRFHEGFAPLLESGKLKHLLVQFRYDFADGRESRGRLAEIVKRFGDTFELAVEVRHRSWQRPEGLEFLAELGVGVCNLDYPTGSRSFDMPLCTVGRKGYFRMHGRNVEKWFSKAGRDETYDYYYNSAELSQIKQRLDKLAQAFERLTVIANNHYRGAELANALELKALLTGRKMAVPEGLIRAYPNLARIASNA